MAKYKAGQSGNPAGRPKGIQDRRTVLRELLEPHSEGLIKKAVDMALEGDTTALRLCLERICPPIRSTGEPVTISGLEGSLSEQGRQIISSMGEGTLTPAEAAQMLSSLASQTRIQEADELERRIEVLEAANEH